MHNDQKILQPFFEQLSKSKNPVLFLDYDGTMAPFVAKREEAVPYVGIREVLRAMVDETKTRIILVTGRPIVDVIPLLDLQRPVEVFGGHGWEHQKPSCEVELGELKPEVQKNLQAANNWIASKNYQVYSESKHASVTIHWRGLPADKASEMETQAREVWTPLTENGDLELHAFDGGLELRALGRNKGDVIREVLQDKSIDAAAFLGDDKTDEDGFKALNDCQSLKTKLAILVRENTRDTNASAWIKPPHELIAFLNRWKNNTKTQKNGSENSQLNQKPNRLLIASNRLPCAMKKDEKGKWNVTPSPGGLVTALNPILEKSRGTWVGWIGTEPDEEVDSALREASKTMPCELVSVPLTEEDVSLYYRGFSNESLWPLLHDLLGYCKFEEKNWERYCEVNERFADQIIASAEPDHVVWVHDYQLFLVGKYLREKGYEGPIVYFLHIPFPTSDLFRRLPWRKEIIDALMCYDTVGFQTHQDHENFVNTVCWMYDDVGVRETATSTILFLEDRRVRVGNWAISIDYDEFHNHANSEEVSRESWLFHEHFGTKKIVMGLDRLDYTKGIPERFLAFGRFLEKYPELHGQVCLYQCVVPSRTHVPDYQNLKESIDMLVGRINGKFSKAGWTPIHYAYRSLTRTELLGRYHACEVALITPLRDGMNLVCKEYLTSCTDDRGVLILSEFAGAAEQLGDGAVTVNPFDVEKTADAIYQAFTMATEERAERLRKLRNIIREKDVHNWVQSIFQAAGIEFES